ncbi:ATP-dependent DNA helicase DDM1 [Capsicum annuum]|nr:ATP-dependent DNA helicase DDM1 [Capsicum annuum]
MKGVKRFVKKGKLSPRYVGPFRILCRSGKIAYELELPSDQASVHPVFHVSLLKKCIGDPEVVVPIQSIDIQNSLSSEEIPVEILDYQTRRLRNKEVPLVKVSRHELQPSSTGSIPVAETHSMYSALLYHDLQYTEGFESSPEEMVELLKDYDMSVLYHLGKTNVVEDALSRLTKSAHFFPVHTSYTAEDYARLYIRELVRLHGVPLSIISNRAERTIQTLEDMLRAYALYFKGSWDEHLPLIEFAYNNSYHASIKMAPFETLYGRRYRSPIGWFKVGEATLIGPDIVFEAMEKVKLIRERLKTAQSRQKSYADVRRRDLEFEVNDLVCLEISPIKRVKRFGKKGKLSPRYVGPYRILSRVGRVAYELELPAELSAVHPIFHVSMLKRHIGDSVVVDPSESLDIPTSLSFEEIPVEILDHQIYRLRNKEVQVLSPSSVTDPEYLYLHLHCGESSWFEDLSPDTSVFLVIVLLLSVQFESIGDLSQWLSSLLSSRGFVRLDELNNRFIEVNTDLLLGMSSLSPKNCFGLDTEMVANADNGVKDITKTDSPVSVLADEGFKLVQLFLEHISFTRYSLKDTCKEEIAVKLEDEVFLDAKNGDVSLLSESMAKEEENLIKTRAKEEEVNGPKEAPNLNDLQFSKLDELLTQTQLYSEFLLEKMDNITVTGMEDEEKGSEDTKKGRRRKRRATTSYDNKKAKRAVAVMLSRSNEGGSVEDSTLTEEERAEKEQAELVPLLTGGKLKSYQLKGVKWLISLWQNGLNGILADQMGLGKTIQTISFLAHLKGNGLDGPYLVIAPLSTLSNWVNEIERFVPSINAIIYQGDKKQRDEIRRKHMPRTIGPKFPIVVTSYEIAMSDAKKFLRHYNWKYLVVDEGHRLKNSKCKLLKELKMLPIENKLLLTGTPLQNNLAELWSLLNFILPDIFSSLEEFESWFDLAGRCGSEAQKEEMEEKRRARVVAKLHGILRPFLLRRLKVDVEQMLPRKKEIILYATMTEHQKKFQDHLINRTLESYLTENVSIGNHCKGKLNNLMIQLRKNCNHPDLLESAYDGSFRYPPVEQIVGQCGKFRLLERLLSVLLARKHKVLVFSQWTKVLDIMDYYFSEKGFEVCRIDGNVKLDERKRQIKDFNDVNSDFRIFLLSTRAGGLGINLTAADTCILYDSDWNPQMDLQAMDRCHRIGQTKPVHVYRLSTALSVEGRMLKRAFSKLKLEHVVIGKGQFKQERSKPATDTMEEEDLMALLRDDDSEEDKLMQTDISDEDLQRVLDRSDLVAGPPNEDVSGESSVNVLPLKGPGWEVVIPTESAGMLSTLNS